MFQDNKVIFSTRGPWGIPVDVGASLGLLCALYLFYTVSGGAGILWPLAFLLTLVGSVFLHELGHAWACHIQDVPVRRIMLYGGGGFCERRRSATRYEQELIVAMGPIVNLTIWAVASLFIHWMLSQTMAGNGHIWFLDAYPYIALVAKVNFWLAIFNLLPVEPLDGGKLFFLILARLLPSRVAAKIAAAVGLVIAVLWIPAAILFFLTFGWILFFMPSIRHNWQALRA